LRPPFWVHPRSTARLPTTTNRPTASTSHPSHEPPRDLVRRRLPHATAGRGSYEGINIEDVSPGDSSAKGIEPKPGRRTTASKPSLRWGSFILGIPFPRACARGYNLSPLSGRAGLSHRLNVDVRPMQVRLDSVDSGGQEHEDGASRDARRITRIGTGGRAASAGVDHAFGPRLVLYSPLGNR